MFNVNYCVSSSIKIVPSDTKFLEDNINTNVKKD